MSFIDLMADYVWSEADISARTEAIVRSQFSAEEEAVVNRRIQGVGFGVPLTADQIARIMVIKQVLLDADQAGADARADMALLAQAQAVEAGALDPTAVPQNVTDLVAARAASHAKG